MKSAASEPDLILRTFVRSLVGGLVFPTVNIYKNMYLNPSNLYILEGFSSQD